MNLVPENPVEDDDAIPDAPVPQQELELDALRQAAAGIRLRAGDTPLSPSPPPPPPPEIPRRAA
ncbi:MAG: hypothetical protein GY715_02565 [Planctomycetes bacterium]|nr:hypothetical protein [Planctomycetota bacterium]